MPPKARLGVPCVPIFGVALGPATLYLARPFGSVKSCPLSGGCSSAEDETSLVVAPGPFAMAADGSNIYWSEYGYFVGSADADAAIRTCPLAGCDLSTAKVLAVGAIWPYAIAVDDANVFYTDYRNGRVERTPKNDVSQA